MARRIAAMFGFIAVIALALTLLYRVYLHHNSAEPYVEDDEAAVVWLDGSVSGDVKIASAEA